MRVGRVNFGEKTKNIIFLKTVVKNHEIYVFLSHRNHPNNSESTITVVHLALKIVKEIRKIYKGKCCPSAFFIFFFEKNISDGQISRDCIPEAQMLLLTPISGYNDHYSPPGLNGHNRQNGHNWPNGQTAILAIMIIIARYGCQKERLGFRNAVTGNLTI